MITFEQVTIAYDGATSPTLHDVSFHIGEGELCLVAGLTGSGKSTLLGAVNGLVPHFTGGTLTGRVVVDGRSTRDHPPRELADVVGVVGQDPLAGFVTDTVEEELAYAMEQLGLPAAVMRKRVEETLDLLRLAELRRRPLRDLSGGQQQRVAIGAVLTAHPRVLVLDEPTSALDPTAAEDVLATVTRLVHDLGVTVLLAEHRLERVVQYADRVLVLPGDGSVIDGEPAAVFATAPVAPPVVELGRLAGWSPVPLSVRDARRLAGPLQQRLIACQLPAKTTAAVASSGARADAVRTGTAPARARRWPHLDAGRRTSAPGVRSPVPPDEPLVRVRSLSVRFGAVVAVREVDLDLAPGEVVALMGRNGSGKTSLLWAVQGSGRRSGGTVAVRHGGKWTDPATLDARQARRLVSLVPQTPSDLLYRTTVADELRESDVEADAPDGSTRELFASLVGEIAGSTHPRDLSEGQRLALVLSIQLAAQAGVVLLDEPTRGLDYAAKERLGAQLTGVASEGRAVLCSTHDVEFVAGVADRVVVLADGDVVADGCTADVLAASPAFAPQVAKILAPQPWLTVRDVADALESRAAAPR